MGTTGMWSEWHRITVARKDLSCHFWTVRDSEELTVTQSHSLSVDFYSNLSHCFKKTPVDIIIPLVHCSFVGVFTDSKNILAIRVGSVVVLGHLLA